MTKKMVRSYPRTQTFESGRLTSFSAIQRPNLFQIQYSTDGGASMRAAKVDANHMVIVNALRRAGARVQSLAMVGHGCPDLIVMMHNNNTGRVEALLVEIKTDKGKLTSYQQKFHEASLDGDPVIVARSADDVLKWFGRLP